MIRSSVCISYLSLLCYTNTGVIHITGIYGNLALDSSHAKTRKLETDTLYDAYSALAATLNCYGSGSSISLS